MQEPDDDSLKFFALNLYVPMISSMLEPSYFIFVGEIYIEYLWTAVSDLRSLFYLKKLLKSYIYIANYCNRKDGTGKHFYMLAMWKWTSFGALIEDFYKNL